MFGNNDVSTSCCACITEDCPYTSDAGFGHPNDNQRNEPDAMLIGLASTNLSDFILTPNNDFHHQNSANIQGSGLVSKKTYSFPGKIEKRNHTCRTSQWFNNYNKRRVALRNYGNFLVFPSTYPICGLDEHNESQIMNQIQRGLFNEKFTKFTLSRIEQGMLRLFCADKKTKEIAIEVINKLAFRMGNESEQRPLIITQLSSLALILLSCKVDRNIDWDKFMRIFSIENNLSASFWCFYKTTDVEGQKQEIFFFVDPKTFIDILKRGNNLSFKKEQIEIKELHNIFKSDMNDFTMSDTTLIMFHWYVKMQNGVAILPSFDHQYIKELTLHQLPFDFDGGRVFKNIIELMNLKKIIYGNIPLILNGQKQNVEKFEANNTQIQSFFEMFRQFPSIKSFRLTLNETNNDTNIIESIVNPQTNLFNGLEHFEVDDNSKYQRTFGVFLGLLNNMRNLKKLSLKTQDRNINVLLEEFLRFMPKLEEIYLTSTAPRSTERLQIIKLFASHIRKLSVAQCYVEDAKIIFGCNSEICSTDK